MIRVVTVENVRQLIEKVTLKRFFLQLIDCLQQDYSRWDEFEKCPRHAMHVPKGIIELMPIVDHEYYAFKCVNGHPLNPEQNKQSVVAIGQLSLSKNGYPVLISEMTLLTALKTAATSAWASQFLARKNAKRLGIIGTGAQSEFQILAHHYALGMSEIYYFDRDPHAMKKFAQNLEAYSLQLYPCNESRLVVEKSDIITTATAQLGHHKIIEESWVEEGLHINKIGGDSPGKTELDPALVAKCKIIVELWEQTKREGEIQQVDVPIYGALWELATGKKKGRETDKEITLFDSVGFALEDYSVLKFIYTLSETYNIGHQLDMVPEIANPKNLFSLISGF